MASSDLPPPYAPLRRPGPFAPVPAHARLTFVWAAPLMTAVFLILGNIASIPVAIPFVAAAMMRGAEAAEAVGPALLAAMALVSFAAFAGGAMFWTSVFERRSLPTIGFRRSPLLYLRGLAVGFLFAGALVGVSALAAPEDMGPALSGLGLLWGGGAGLVFLLVLFLVFVIQSGAEEVVCRGWMLSAIAARRGPLVAVAVSSIGFALLHFHYAFFAPLTGMLVIAGVALIGVVLSFYALTERSIWGVCGVHCAYNFTLMSLTVGQALSENPGLSPLDVVVEALTNITSVTEYDPSLPGTIAVLGVLSLAAWRVWRRAERRRGAMLLAD